MAVHISCAPRSTCAQEMCVEVDAIAASTAATQKHNNQSFDAERWGSSVGAIDEEEEAK